MRTRTSNFREPIFDVHPRFTSLAPVNFTCWKHHKSKSRILLRNYELLPLTNFEKILSYFNANRSQFIETTDFEHLISES